jgi:TatD DNase family protein
MVTVQFIDTHCHLTFEPLAEQIDQVLARSRQAGITGWISIGTDLDHSQRCVALAGQYKGIWATVGLHPHDAGDMTDDLLEQFKQLCSNEKVVAIGETGLDYHYNYSDPQAQRRAFIQQLELAEAFHLPVVVHTREAFDETITILDDFRQRVDKVVLHCFTGTAQQAQIALDRGFMLSFTGVVTFKNARLIQDAARMVPLDRMMLETDCPYMSPEPVRKQRPNEPGLLIHTAQCLAELKGIDLEQMARKVTENAVQFFGIQLQ